MFASAEAYARVGARAYVSLERGLAMACRRLAVASAVLLAIMATGCAGPLVVSAVQSRATEVQFGYTQAGSGDQGIISCTVPEGGGDLTNCRHMTIKFKD